MQRLSRRFAQLIQPDLPVESPRINDERVTFPLPCRIPMPGGSYVSARNEFTAIHENLPPEIESLMNKKDPLRRLDHSPGRRSEKDFGYTLRQAIGVGFLSPMQSCCAFIVDRFCGRLEWDGFLQVFTEVSQISGRWIPNTGKVWFSIGQARRRCREVGPAFSRSRDGTGWNLAPPGLCNQRLRRKRHSKE